MSLDFELHWGVRDHEPARGPYASNLLGARSVIPRLLEMFEEFGAAATWATVGFLFAEDRDELSRFRPSVLPAYLDPTLSPYEEEVGQDEGEDPLHFAPTLIDSIRRAPRQEIGTHTFSHYFCGESGQSEESFGADIEAAVAIAAKCGIRIRSIVFPRNQFNPGYVGLLLVNGITAFRGNPRSWMWRFENTAQGNRWWKRAGRFGDAYLPLGGNGLVTWDGILRPDGLSDIAASQMLRTHGPRSSRLAALHLQRLRGALRSAARSGKIFHLWWHPHNFGRFQDENLLLLRAILEEYRECRVKYGMTSLNMAEVDDMVRSRFGVTVSSPIDARAL